MSKYVQLGELINSISKTHKLDKNELIFLNTSDVLEGKILKNHFSPISELKGQAKKTIQNGDILYSEIRPKNRRYTVVKNLINPEDYIVSTKLMVLRNRSTKLDTDYLYYFLTSEDAINYLQRKAENRIGSFPQITFDVLKNVQIRLPDINEQKRIASVLSAFEDKIELNNKINAELEAMAKTLYDYWFVQFDFPDANGKPYKSSGGKMAWNGALKREIPEGWEVKRLADILNFTTGKLDSNAEVQHGEYPFFTCSANPSKTDTFAFDDNALLIAGNNANGNFHLNRYDGKFNAYQRTYVLTSEHPEYLEIAYQVLKYELKALKSKGNGSQTKFLTISMLTNIPVIIPGKNILSDFGEYSISINIKQQNCLKQNQELAQLRDWLLPMLMNGQVTVGEAEEKMGMVAEGAVEYKL